MSIWEQLFTSLMRMFVEFIVIVVVVSAMLFLYNVNTVNSYISQCNAIVARSGGLTQKAYNKCQMYSKDYYHGYFQVSVQKGTYATYSEAKDVSHKYPNESDEPSRYNYLTNSDDNENDNSQTDEVAFGQPTTYYIYSKVPFLRNLPDIPKIYYGTKDTPSSPYSSNTVRGNISSSNNGKEYNASNNAAPIEEDVHSLIRAGSQN